MIKIWSALIYILEIMHNLKRKRKEYKENYDKSCLEPTRSKMAKDLTSSEPWALLYTHYNPLAAKWYTHQCCDHSEANRKKSKSGPVSWNLCLFPKIGGITLSLTSLWNYPAHKN